MKCRRHIVFLLARAWRYHPIGFLWKRNNPIQMSIQNHQMSESMKDAMVDWQSLFERQWEWITNSFRRENVNRHRRLTNFMVTQNNNAWKLPTWFLCVCSLPDANIHPMGRERRKSNRHTLSLSRMQIALISQSIQRSLSPPRCTKIRRCSKMI